MARDPNLNGHYSWRKLLPVDETEDDFVQYSHVSSMQVPQAYRRLAVYSTNSLGLVISEVRVLGIRKFTNYLNCAKHIYSYSIMVLSYSISC